jgi:hypothetical protein
MRNPAPCGPVRGVSRLRADAKDSAGFARTKRPMLVLTGEKASGEFLIQQGRLVADNVEGFVIKESGHWHQVIPKLAAFFSR